MSDPQTLAARVERLESRLDLVEHLLVGLVTPEQIRRAMREVEQSGHVPVAPASTATPAPPAAPPAAVEAPAAASAPAALEPASVMPEPLREASGMPEPARDAAAKPDWERLIGGRWALWIGVLAIFLAASFFLANAWQMVPPAGRVAAGGLLGLGLLGAGARARGRGEPWFADGLAGAGLGLLYLDVWGAYARYALVPIGPTFGLLLVTTALGAWLAVRHNALSQAVIASLGAFLTPLLLGDRQGWDFGIALYAVVVDLGLLAISLARHWPPLAWTCLAGTALLWLSANPTDVPLGGLAVATLLFGLFATTAVGYGLRHGERNTPHDALLLLACALPYAAAGYFQLAQGHEWAQTPFMLALSGLFLAGGLAVRRLQPANEPFRMGCEALAVFFLTLALPIWLEQDWLAIAWVVEATLIGALGTHFGERSLTWLGRAVALPAAIALGMLLFAEPSRWAVPLLNERALPFVLAAACAAAAIAWGWRHGKDAGWLAPLALVGSASAWILTDLRLASYHWELVPSQLARLGAVGIAALAAAFHAAAVRRPDRPVRQLMLAWWTLAVALLLCGSGYAVSPFAELRPLATLWVLGTGVAIVAAGRALPAGGHESGGRFALPLGLVLLAVWGVSIEVFDGARILAAGDDRAAHLALSLVWIVSGVCCLLGGVRLALRPFRLLGLALLGASVVKVFLFDLAFLDTPFRVAAFAGLGVALIGISWLYGRYGVQPTGNHPDGVQPAGSGETEERA